MRHLRKLLLILAMSGLLSLGALAFEIQGFSTTVGVGADNSYTVSETILVDFTASDGTITRVIPLTTPSGRTASVRRLSVTGSEYDIQRSRDRITITLGDPNSTISVEAFGISYVYDVGYDFDESRDIFRFQLVNPELEADIREFSYTVTMPAPLEGATPVLTSGYYGRIKDPGYSMSGNVVSGLMSLMAFESITFELELPNEYFTQAVYRNNIMDAIQSLAPIVCILLILSATVVLLTRCKNPTLSPEPSGRIPEGLSPADVAYLINGSLAQGQLTGLIPYWATAGYVIIKDNPEGGVTLVRAAPMGSERPEYERRLFEQMFPVGPNLRLSGPSRELRKALSKARHGLIAHWKDSFLPQRRIFPLLAVWLPLISCVLASLGCGNSIYRAAMSVFVMIPLFLLVGVVSWAPCLVWGWLGKKQGHRRNLWGFVLGAAWIAAVAVSLLRNDASFVSVAALGLSMAGAFMTGLYLWDMTPRSAEGLELLGQCLALRDYIRYSTDDQVRETASGGLEAHFYQLLPYAGIFRLEGVWADRFMSLRITPPLWFDAQGETKLLTPLAFLARLEERMQRVKLAFTGMEGDRAMTITYVRAAAKNLMRPVLSRLARIGRAIARAFRFVRQRLRRRRDGL